MKFGKYLSQKLNPEWQEGYLDYAALKELIKEAGRESDAVGSIAFSPRETSLSVQRVTRDAAEEKFFTVLEREVRKVGDFTSKLVAEITAELDSLSQRSEACAGGDNAELLEEAKQIGNKFLALEKFVNLNYLGFHKAVKKHDKQLPHAPCQQFYTHILRTQPWAQGDQSQLLIKLSAIYAQLRGQPAAAVATEIEGAVPSARQASETSISLRATRLHTPSTRSEQATSTRFWVRREDTSAVQHHIMQHLPVAPIRPDGMGSNTELVNVVYLDNSRLELYHSLLDKRPNAVTYRLRWEGPMVPKYVTLERVSHRPISAVLDSLQLPEASVVAFLKGVLRVGDMTGTWRALGKSEIEVRDAAKLFDEIQCVVESKQLAPVLHTQAQRTTFASPVDPTVSIAMGSNVQMMRTVPFQLLESDKWCRDPTTPLSRTDVTRFPHVVLDVRLQFPATHSMPAWLQDLVNSGYLTEVDSFSKLLHGCAALLPDLAQAVPFWIDDVSVRESLLACSPSPERSLDGDRDGSVAGPSSEAILRRRKVSNLNQMSHPLLGDRPTLQLLPSPSDIAGLRNAAEDRTGFFNWWFLDRESTPPPAPLPAHEVPLLEGQTRLAPPPKNVFALERTYLTWTHMAVTVGSVSVAMLGFSSGGDSGSGTKGLAHFMDGIAILLLPMAIVIACYALTIYIIRLRQEHSDEEGLYRLDKVGPPAMAGFIVAILATIFVVGAVDFIQCL